MLYVVFGKFPHKCFLYNHDALSPNDAQFQSKTYNKMSQFTNVRILKDPHATTSRVLTFRENFSAGRSKPNFAIALLKFDKTMKIDHSRKTPDL